MKSKNDFSFMAPNIEPIIHGLMWNDTSTKLVNNLDQDLLNPYKDNINVKSNEFNTDTFMSDFNKKLSENQVREKTEKKVALDKSSYKQDEMNLMNKIDNIKEIIKNNTISQLNNFKNLQNENTQIMTNTKKGNKETEKFPMIFKMNKIDPYENFKLLKFKESNGDNISQERKIESAPDQNSPKFPNIRNVLNSDSLIKSSEILPNYKNIKSNAQNKPAESTNKMMENITNEEKKIKNLNLHDEDKLFIKDIKNNINKLDDISKKFKNI